MNMTDHTDRELDFIPGGEGFAPRFGDEFGGWELTDVPKKFDTTFQAQSVHVHATNTEHVGALQHTRNDAVSNDHVAFGQTITTFSDNVLTDQVGLGQTIQDNAVPTDHDDLYHAQRAPVPPPQRLAGTKRARPTADNKQQSVKRQKKKKTVEVTKESIQAGKIMFEKVYPREAVNESVEHLLKILNELERINPAQGQIARIFLHKLFNRKPETHTVEVKYVAPPKDKEDEQKKIPVQSTHKVYELNFAGDWKLTKTEQKKSHQVSQFTTRTKKAIRNIQKGIKGLCSAAKASYTNLQKAIYKVEEGRARLMRKNSVLCVEGREM